MHVTISGFLHIHLIAPARFICIILTLFSCLFLRVSVTTKACEFSYLAPSLLNITLYYSFYYACIFLSHWSHFHYQSTFFLFRASTQRILFHIFLFHLLIHLLSAQSSIQVLIHIFSNFLSTLFSSPPNSHLSVHIIHLFITFSTS